MIGGDTMSRQIDLDKHAIQLNPNNDAFWASRGWDNRPDDWEDRVDDDMRPDADGAS